MCAWYETGNVEEFDWDGAFAVCAGAVVGLAFVLDVEAGAGAVDLEVANGSLGIDSCKSVMPMSMAS